ncbi:TonB-dependent receptor [Kordiimonas lacus]|uniref:Outer membrane receptor proteins, mostly Fe transport n=1 Tax=Kordiimonas lacus TaxID=637679 RepID=A0A1G6US53_9PROT|nr:TonB-dependent receptor [Kordiimonas lacus]SDD43546.1 Outer membrane receptor proteins, mostly Fe transport [Kordiimonas lacus]
MIQGHETYPQKKHRHVALLSGAATALALAVTGSNVAQAQDSQDTADAFSIDEIIVTATRRAGSVQDVPINIAAVGGAQIEEQGFEDISDILAYVPGINVVDRGGRNGNRLIVRGLNADSLGQGSASANGGTVSTYLGEIPIYIDLKLNDLERVETLLGPQGTLYGAGTLGGAIRYIPNKPKFDETTFEVRGDAYMTKHGDGVSTDTGFTINVPVSDNFAIRGSLDYLDYKGFIDYGYVVNDIGVSEPDGANADITSYEDMNGQEALSGRIAARWEPTDSLDATLTYYFQNSDNEGRQTSGWRGPLNTDRYESPSRVLEPNETENELLALEITADLGFAELTSASGIGGYKENGQRDQTDLLISLEYSYETFPTFTAFTREDQENSFFNQEVRLVSKGEHDYNWIIGGYYNKFNSTGTSAEFTPGYAAFAGFDRPDDLEYYSTSVIDLTEKAVFGEFGYDITDRWQVTVGARYYEYKLETSSTVDFPLFDPGFTIPDFDGLGDRAPDPDAGQEDSGWLFKINSSYEVNDDMLVYATVSQGYRIGNSNGIGQCDAFDPDKNQGACALAEGQVYDANGNTAEFDERFFTPDKTTNYELGAKTTWLDGDLTLNAALFYVKWSDPQLGSATVNASIPITINASGAESKGIEMSGNWRVTDRFSLRGAFSYTKSELTDDVPSLIRTIPTPTSANPNPGFATIFIDGKSGDRLPGSPTTQFSLFANYDQPLDNGATLRYNLGYAYQGHVLSRTGTRGGGLTLDDFGIANASVVYDTEDWTVTAYIDNLFNEFAETGVQSTSRSNQIQQGATVRSFQTTVLTPRQVGLRFTYRFGL